jgi:hypothetical protein
MQLKGYFTHRNVFVLGVVLLATGMPVSRFLVSVAQILLLVNWLAERNFADKWQTLKRSGAFWSFTGIYLFYIVGLIWTDDFSYGIKDLRVKLPMLWLPLLFFTSPQLGKKEYHAVLHFFVGATIIASFWSMAVYLGLTPIRIHDVREISRFESHIRFSLMIVLSILYLFFVLLRKDTKFKLLYALAVVWLLSFLVLLQSITGIVIVVIIACTALSWMLVSKNSYSVKAGFAVLVTGGALYLAYIVRDEWKSYYATDKVNFSEFPTKRLNGHWYWSDTLSRLTENGHYVWLDVSDDLMQQEWNRRSWRKYDSLDYNGNPLSHTLVRYLASKNLPRDSVGVSELTDEDIHNIENGYSNYLYANKGGLRARVHELIWELDMAAQKNDPTGHSLTMRFEFWKTAWHIIQKKPLLGVGTGDLEKALKQQYLLDKTSLQPRWQLHSHNQFLAIGVALGFIGVGLFMLSFFTPFIFLPRRSLFFLFFLLIQFLSFFNEDTLETQAGVTFCVFFTQFLFQNDEYNL